MTLTNKEIKALKGEAHHLKPVVRVGQKGITENLIQEAEQALDTHELIKLHIAGDDREMRKATIATIAEKTGAEIISTIGKTCTLYRKRDSDS